MPLTLSALIVAATMPALMQQSVASVEPTEPIAAVRRPAPSLSEKDSVRALKIARRAQSDFEVVRRRLLPIEDAQEGACDAVIGRYCYREQMGFGPPAEAPEVIGARMRLLTVLDSLGRLLPGDRWILGQKLRYYLEEGRVSTADSVAVRCAANTLVPSTVGWCLALIGYVAQERGDYARADAAFTNALAAMPEKERCEFQDLSILLDGRAAGQYKHATCQARDSLAVAFWRLVQPLYLTGVNDLRTEFLARITRMYIERDTRTPMNGRWDSDDRETLLRFGGGQYYTQLYRPPGSTHEAAIASHRRGPAFNFVPDARSLAAPNQLSLEDWEYANVAPRSGYAPAWAGSFQPLLDNQVALFRRGDSAVVVAAFKITDKVTTSSHVKFQAGVFAAAVDSGNIQAPVGTTLNNVGSTVVSTIRALWRPLIVSLEVMDTSGRAAGRARFAPKLPVSGTRLSLSDLLLYTPSDSAPTNLNEAIPRALQALRVPNSRQIGLFWEAYGARPEGEAFEYSLLVQAIGRSWVHRTFIKLHITDPDRSLSVLWSEVPTVTDDIACRGVTVDLSRLKPGRYHVRLSLTGRGEAPIVSERDIEIME